MSEEKVLFSGSSSLVLHFGSFLLGTIVLIGAVVAGFMVSKWIFILAGLAAIFLLGRWIAVKSRIYELTTQRVRIKTGIMTHRTDDLELYRVEDITLIEPLMQRIFGAGTIRLATGDSSSPMIELEAVPGAKGLREEMRKAIEECRDRKGVRITEFE